MSKDNQNHVRADDTANTLEQIAALGDMQPYEFFSRIMNVFEDEFMAAFGHPAALPMDEFMTMALSYERTQPGGLTGFMKWFMDGDSEIKRDMIDAGGVRIMTTHSSKGLEAPIVFLIDTLRNPHSQTGNVQFNALSPAPDTFICKLEGEPSDIYDNAKADSIRTDYEEYWRLLYVAMTRARDQLYVYGCEERGASESWHSKLYEVLNNMPDAEILEDGTIKIANSVEVKSDSTTDKLLKNEEQGNCHRQRESGGATLSQSRLLQTQSVCKIKNFISADATMKGDLGTRSPHHSSADSTTIKSLANIKSGKFARQYGTDIHKKLQYLQLDNGCELAKKVQSVPELARFWAPNAKTELPISGCIDGKFYSFRIDRVIVREARQSATQAVTPAKAGVHCGRNDSNFEIIDCLQAMDPGLRRGDDKIEVEFLDYKSDKTRERRDEYAAKMKLYAFILQKIYPNAKISGHILWLHDWELDHII